MERRSFPTEFRVEGEGGNRKITGLAARFNSRSPEYYGVREVIEPHFFRAALQSSDPLFALLNHDENFILAERNAGTLAAWEDGDGLRYSFSPSDNQRNRDYVLTPMDRGELTGSSFGFGLKKRGVGYELEDDEETGGVLRRLLPDGADRLYDVSPVAYPYYDETEASARMARSIQDFIKDRKIRMIPENHITQALRKQRARSLFM